MTAEKNNGIYSPTTGYNSEKSSHSILLYRVLPELEENTSVLHFSETSLGGRHKSKNSSYLFQINIDDRTNWSPIQSVIILIVINKIGQLRNVSSIGQSQV